MSVLTPLLKESYDFLFGVDVESREILEEGYPAQFLLTPDFHRENIWTCVFDREVDIESTRLWLLRIIVNMCLTQSNQGGRYISGFKYGGLVVERVENGGVEGIEDSLHYETHPCYRRLGRAWMVVQGPFIRLRHECQSW
jgi:hypothetical protein